MSWKNIRLGEVISHRKEFIAIDDAIEYKRCRVQVNRKGVVLRDEVKGSVINTKKQQVCKAGDFLVAEIDAKVGGYGFVGEDLEGAIVSSHYFLFDVDETKMLKEYLGWLIKTDIIQEQINSKGSTNYAAIRPKNVLDFEIPLPTTISEQKKIVQRLNAVHSEYSFLQSEIEKQKSYLRLLRQTILQEAVQGKLTQQNPSDEPASELLKRIKSEKQKLIKEGKLKKEKELPPIAEEEIPFALPEGWIWCRLGEIFNHLKYGTSQKCDYKKAKHAVLRIPNLSVGIIDFEDLKFANLPDKEFDNLRLEVDDIIVIRSNGSENLVGRSAVFKGAGFDCAYAGYLMRLRFNSKLLSVDYIHLVLESSFIRSLIEQPLRTTSGVKNINSTEVANLLVPLSPFAEQCRIVYQVQALQQKLNDLQAQVEQSRIHAETFLQTVLRESFAGKKNVYGMNEEMTLAAEL